MSYNAKYAGSCFKKLRNKRNLTQKQVAQMTTISEPHYKTIENGVGNPGINNLIELIEFYNVSADSILFPGMSDTNTTDEQINRLLKQHCSENQKQLVLAIIKDILSYTDTTDQNSSTSAESTSIADDTDNEYND